MDEQKKQAFKDRMAKAREARAKKTALKAEGPEPAQVQSNIVLTTDMTQDEKAIASRIMGEERDWETHIDQYATNDFSLAEDPFKLPEPCRKLISERKFNFKWIERTPQRVDMVKNLRDALKWWPVNRTSPVVGIFDKYIDSVTGGVHLLDQLLVFKPWKLWVREQEYKAHLAGSYEDIRSKDGKDDGLEFAATLRKPGEKKTDKHRRNEISGNDIEYEGEADRLETMDLAANE